MNNTNSTHVVLAAMLTENTGRHLLDSGGAYGRDWERNQGMTVDAFVARPAITWDTCSETPTLDVFHYLAGKLRYDKGQTRKFRRQFNRPCDVNHWERNEDDCDRCRRSKDSWLENAEEWAQLRHESDSWSDDRVDSFNSYNSENFLSQTIQGVLYKRNGSWWVILQVHGGCDVRGGYTAPRVFELDCDEWYDLFEWHAYSLVCDTYGDESAVSDALDSGNELPGMGVRDLGVEPYELVHCWDYRSGDWSTYGGSFVDDPRKGSEFGEFDTDSEHYGSPRCPQCGGKATVYTYGY